MLRPLKIAPASRHSHALLLILALFTWLLLLPLEANCAPLMTVFVNGSRVSSYPVIRDGVSYLPIGVMAQALKAEIVWDSSLNIVKVNGEASGATVLNYDGKIYLPIEALVTSLGGTVSFNGRENCIKVQTKDNGSPSASVSRKASNQSNSVSDTRLTVPPVVTTPRPAAPSVGVGNAGTTGSRFSSYTPTSGYGINAKSGTSTSLRPADAPPYLGDNLTPAPVPEVTGASGSGYNQLPSNSQRPSDGVYVPRSAQNSVFQVTVTNLETVNVIKDFYRPRSGYKYVIAYLSQQNVSEQVQIYTGRFSLLDQKAVAYDYVEQLSNFWLVILRPFGVNFGYLVFEIPVESRPVSLVLHALNQSPLTVNL